jgi:hypothetical protein
MSLNYEAPRITELGSVADFTRGDKFAWQFDGMSIAEAIHQVRPGNRPGGGGQPGGSPFGTS